LQILSFGILVFRFISNFGFQFVDSEFWISDCRIAAYYGATHFQHDTNEALQHYYLRNDGQAIQHYHSWLEQSELKGMADCAALTVCGCSIKRWVQNDCYCKT
jgi:hypothetical protein